MSTNSVDDKALSFHALCPYGNDDCPKCVRKILLEITVKADPGTMQATKIAAGFQALLPDGSDVRVATAEEFATCTPKTQYCNENGCLRKVFEPHIYCNKHEDANSKLPTPQPAVNDKALRKTVEDSIRHARMNAVMVERYDHSVAEENILLNVETIMVAIDANRKEATERAEVEAQLKVLRGLPGSAPYVRPDGMVTTLSEVRNELLSRLRTLTNKNEEEA